jgi:hypothetical protein
VHARVRDLLDASGFADVVGADAFLATEADVLERPV